MIDIPAAVVMIVGVNFFGFAAKQANQSATPWVAASLLASLIAHAVLHYSWGGVMVSQLIVFAGITLWRFWREPND